MQPIYFENTEQRIKRKIEVKETVLSKGTVSELSAEIDYNAYLIKYDGLITGYVHKTLKRTDLPQPFEPDDVIQECRIYLWKLLRDKYDPNIGKVDTLIICSVPLIVQNVFYRIISSHNSTGSGRSKRTRKAKLQQYTIPYEDYMEDAANHDYIMEDYNVDMNIIAENMKKKLSEEHFQVFDLIFMNGLNKQDTAMMLERSVSSVSGHMKTFVIPTLIDVLLELEYIEEKK